MQANSINSIFIKSYEKNQIVLSNHNVLNSSFALYDNIFINFIKLDLFNLSTYDFLNSIAQNKEILIVGCGNKFIIPNQEIKKSILSKGLSLEWMTTKNAYHTFNLLIEDYRNVIGLFLNEN